MTSKQKNKFVFLFQIAHVNIQKNSSCGFMMTMKMKNHEDKEISSEISFPDGNNLLFLEYYEFKCKFHVHKGKYRPVILIFQLMKQESNGVKKIYGRLPVDLALLYNGKNTDEYQYFTNGMETRRSSEPILTLKYRFIPISEIESGKFGHDSFAKTTGCAKNLKIEKSIEDSSDEEYQTDDTHETKSKIVKKRSYLPKVTKVASEERRRSLQERLDLYDDFFKEDEDYLASKEAEVQEEMNEYPSSESLNVEKKFDQESLMQTALEKSLKLQIIVMESQIKKQSTQIQELKIQNTEFQKENKNLLKEKESLEIEKESLEKENQNLEIENQDLEKENQNLVKENQDLEKENQNLVKENQDLEKEKVSLVKEKENLLKENKMMKKQNQSLLEVNDDICEKIEQLKEENQKINDKLSRCEEQLKSEPKNDSENKFKEEFIDLILDFETFSATNSASLFENTLSPENLENLGQVGSSFTSTVYKVRYKKTGKIFCQKKLKVTAQFYDFKNLVKEYEILYNLKHPCICNCLGININDEDTPFIFIEYLPVQLENACALRCLTNTLRVRIALEIAIGMEYSHKYHFMHRDLKPSNIMLDDSFSAKICDFGIAKFIDNCDDNLSMTKGIGTLHYMAPEVMKEDDYGLPADVYSFGLLLIYVLTGEESKLSLRDKLEAKRVEIDDVVTEKGKKIIYQCLLIHPDERPKFSEIVTMFKDCDYQLLPDVNVTIIQKRHKELEFINSHYHQE
ncbi:hypothetical protein TRFO_09864 [Tritrichomonas foetus]|uniref:mitogen-activated protein kinase kinase n=1 Tax=Tritrichomonas foetus TaxID=1144522 RepID=A0A1J4JBX4_9EUKA|nr:hypothetical protein TRFO_09864 [Tritrichomonas foetus]|eukprot:OHS96698.1 hypothetical protein TRFO_09864 [Tritrichomonas foetus]